MATWGSGDWGSGTWGGDLVQRISSGASATRKIAKKVLMYLMRRGS